MTASSAESFGVNGAAAPTQLFVINLAASTSPMALSHPSSPELKRFTFFVSRQREEGRERFRLHMGYFDTQEDAEQLLDSVRDVYPAAWAGPAPTTGAGRRGRIAPGSVATASPAPAPAPAAAAAVPVAAAVAPAPVPAKAAATAQPVRPAAAPAPAAARPQPPAADATDATMLAPTLRAPVLQAPAQVPDLQLESMSNVRDVLAQLSESPATDATVRMPLPATPKQQARAPAPVVPKVAAPPAAKAATPAAPRPAAPAKAVAREPELTGVDALSLLEMPAAPASPPVLSSATTTRAPVLPPLANPFAGLENEPEVRLVTPEDTQTLVDIKVDKENNAPPCFAVQLFWSISPIDVGTLPHLAIFDAYTLYNVEGNRQGRKWYGLRLGFFSDPNSATQVANYVRSDYKAVAVVPVAVKERDRARGGAAPEVAGARAPRKTTDSEFSREGMEGFELLTDDRPPPEKRDIEDPAGGRKVANGAPRVAPKAAAAAPVAARPGGAAAPRTAAAGTATGKPVGKRVVARRRAPQPPPGKTVSAGVGGAEVLESTLEILGASTLSLDEGRELITDAAARKPEAKKSAGRFSRLLSRLSGG